MRIWSLHPEYLDAKGLVALWRETLLAKHVLAGKTKGYIHHPQLHRFKNTKEPLEAINKYLSIIHDEALRRNYRFDNTKFDRVSSSLQLQVTKGQLEFEFKHLLNKLSVRDIKLYHKIKVKKKINPHPLFVVVKGDIEDWEIV